MAYNTPAKLVSLNDIVSEYVRKSEAGPSAIAALEAAHVEVRMAASIQGTHSGERTLARETVTPREFADTLLKSAWRHVYAGLNIAKIATAADKKRFDTFFVSPPEFTIQNIRNEFGDYLIDPRQHILRGLAECFVSLDDAYKSHSKVRIGVKGLPKRVIITRCGGYHGYGRDQLENIFDAINRCEDRPAIEHAEMSVLMDTARKEGLANYRDMTLKLFANGNGHLHFGADSLLTINRGLAEYYGEVLPDAPTENAKKKQSTDVSTDLAFYPTPKAVVEAVLSAHIEFQAGEFVLEPSCGDGAFLDAIRKKSNVKLLGIEVDHRRAQICRDKGHNVLIGNFLEAEPHQLVDWIIMNPPFAGRHYLKHISKAIEWLKPGGKIVAILPATAWYDHKSLPESVLRGWNVWRDLPVGSFSESGTNVPTGVWKYAKATS